MEFERLFDVFYYQQERYPLQVALAEKVNKQWVTYSTADVIQKINEISRGLYKYGIRPGDKIAIIAPSRPAWNFLDIGMMQIGAINVPVYPNISLNDYLYIFKEADVRLAFVADKALYNKISSIRDQLPGLENIYTINEVPGAPNWKQFLEVGNEELDKAIERIKAGINKDDLATIIYTSGTTGNPKGVMLSHWNIASNAMSAASVLPVYTYMRVLSSLPICHVFERTVCYLFMYIGASVYYAERVESIGENLKEVKPHFFSTVPRLMEKMYERIVAKGNELTGVKKKLFDWALGLAQRYDPDRKMSLGYSIQLALARKLVFKKWQEAVGGEVTGIVSGAAALPPYLARIFNAAGIVVKEGYGQTESSPVIAVNRFEKGWSRIGTVGPPIPGVEIKIAEDGEICIKGPNVMLGYYKHPELTAEAIDKEGWLHTGDVGMLVDNRFLKITDRKKELFKTSGGKYVAPQVIENSFKESSLIEHIMVVGENKKSVSAIIVPAIPSLQAWCEENGLSFSSNEEMLSHPMVVKKYSQVRDEYNKGLSEVEQVKKFTLLLSDWSIESGELTPTLKLKRKVIMEKYEHIIAELYKEGR
jgi:long-chain acyl-CoA synthetase